MKSREELKKEAAVEAVKFVRSGMKLGLGTGSTAKYAVEEIGRKLNSGELKDILCIPTSESTRKLAESLGIPLTDFENVERIDLTIDGADEVDSKLNLIKGGGGALLREKIVAQASEKEIIIVDETKLSDSLGKNFPLPVEIVPFALHPIKRLLENLGAEVQLRKSEEGIFVTDEGHWILDAKFESIDNPYQLSSLLNEKAGVVEHGLFLDVVDVLIIGKHKGTEIIYAS